jgi:hypothetical protein
LKIEPRRAEAVARKAAKHLAELVKPDGSFVYRYVLADPSITDSAYSTIRHIGAAWALLLAADDMPEIGEAAGRATRFMAERIFRPYGRTNALCVLDEGFIKLGGSALGVVACLAMLMRSGDGAYLERAVRLADHIVSQRASDGEFVQIRRPDPLAPPHPRRGENFAGQPIMALALIGEATGEEKYLGLAYSSAEQLARRGFGVGTVAHWTLYALEALARIRPEPWMFDFAEKLHATAFADRAITEAEESTPIACLTEGALAYARMLNAAGRTEAAGAALANAGELLSRQLRFFHPSGAFFASVGRQEVQIDIIRHNLLGFLGYAALTREAER